jgi:hypothetical protein
MKRDVTKTHRLGGLHDRIYGMTDMEIVEYILKKAETFKELNSAEKLTTLANSYGLNKETETEVADEIFLEGGFGGLHDYIYRTERKTLEKWALTAEKHHRNVKNLRLMGGLHDYIERLSNAEVAEYILEKAQLYPELNSGAKLDAYAETYGVKH